MILSLYRDKLGYLCRNTGGDVPHRGIFSCRAAQTRKQSGVSALVDAQTMVEVCHLRAEGGASGAPFGHSQGDKRGLELNGPSGATQSSLQESNTILFWGRERLRSRNRRIYGRSASGMLEICRQIVDGGGKGFQQLLDSYLHPGINLGGSVSGEALLYLLSYVTRSDAGVSRSPPPPDSSRGVWLTRGLSG